VEFEWGAAKELANISKHKASFTEAVETFFDPNSFQMTDLKHSGREPRYYWIGKSNHGRILTTWFTKRGATIRIIGSAQWRQFQRLYNETTKPK
jgi:uncharacterized protein